MLLTERTATRVGYRWLNGDRSWIFGLNAGYDSRLLKSGDADTGVNVTNKRTVGFQQIALNAETVSNSWTLNGYGLIPLGRRRRVTPTKKARVFIGP